MNPVMKTAMRMANKAAVAVYRATGGRVGGKASGGVPVLLLTVTGRRTGQPRTTPVGYFDLDGGYVVVGSAGGLPTTRSGSGTFAPPAAPRSSVGGSRTPSRSRELTGQERDTAWQDSSSSGAHRSASTSGRRRGPSPSRC